MTGGAARGQRRFAALFLAPAFILFTAFVAYPGARALGYSLVRWNGFTAPEFVGLDNFRQLFREGDLFFGALLNNVILALGGGSLTLVLALAFAAMLHRKVHGASVYRVAFFFPNVLASVAIALLWVLLYSVTDFGIINAALGALQRGAAAAGLPVPPVDLPYPFLASQHLIYALIPMMVWAAVGFYMVLFLAAMGSIPETYYEAAKLDGATPFQQFRHITLPLIREVITVGVIFLIISSLKFFDPIWVMENQRPARDSHVMATLLQTKVFSEYVIGYGAAVAVMLFIFVFAATLVSLRLSRAERVEY